MPAVWNTEQISHSLFNICHETLGWILVRDYHSSWAPRPTHEKYINTFLLSYLMYQRLFLRELNLVSRCPDLFQIDPDTSWYCHALAVTLWASSLMPLNSMFLTYKPTSVSFTIKRRMKSRKHCTVSFWRSNEICMNSSEHRPQHTDKVNES